MLELLTVVKLNNLPLLLLLQIDSARSKLRQLDNDSVQEGASMLAAAASRLKPCATSNSARQTITPMEVERQAVKDVQAPVSSTASTTAEVPSTNRQPSTPVTTSTDAMQVEPAISSAQHVEELQSPDSIMQPARAATATKMDTEVGIGLSCRHA